MKITCHVCGTTHECKPAASHEGDFVTAAQLAERLKGATSIDRIVFTPRTRDVVEFEVIGIRGRGMQAAGSFFARSKDADEIYKMLVKLVLG